MIREILVPAPGPEPEPSEFIWVMILQCRYPFSFPNIIHAYVLHLLPIQVLQLAKWIFRAWEQGSVTSFASNSISRRETKSESEADLHDSMVAGMQGNIWFPWQGYEFKVQGSVHRMDMEFLKIDQPTILWQRFIISLVGHYNG